MKTRAFVVYSVVMSLLDQVVLLFVLLVVLPAVGLTVPRSGIVLGVVVLAVVSVVLTWLNLKAVGLKTTRSPDVGVRGRVVKTLAPGGYVRVGNELWPAVCETGRVESGESVTVVRMDGLRLVVERATEEPDAP